MVKRMLMNVVDPEEARVAILEDDVLEELYIERPSEGRHAGDIYKAKVLNVESSFQAAFVDLGRDRNGFLHASDIMPGLDGHLLPNTIDPLKSRRREEIPIAELIHRGQEVIVQISKESMGSKGPSVTTYLSIPGRYLVLTPGVRHYGVSRKIEDEEAREKLKVMLTGLELPQRMGFIVRTAGEGKTKRDLATDLRNVMRIWQAIEERARTVPTPALLYEESDLVIRCVRDLFTSDTDELLIDSEEAAKRAKDYLRIISPTYLRKVKFHEGPAPLFHKFGIEDEIDRIMRRKVNLKSGGALVIEQTEAMVVVDVNSGSYTEEKDAEETAFRTNMEAAPEIARQLRLRDLGGLIAIDFIDMKQERHRRAVERELARAMRRDRARSKALHISRFGIVEMTRQRVRPGISLASQAVCPVCKGIGLVKSVESMALYLMRQVRMRLSKPDVESIEVITNPEVASFVLNTKRRDIVALETETGKSISIRSSAEHGAEAIEFNVTKTTKEKEATGKPHVRDRRPRRQPAQSARG